MKKLRIIITLGIFLTGFTLNAQTPPDINFDNVELNWSILHQDTTLPALFELYDNINSSGNPSDIFFRDTKVIGEQLFSLFTTNLNTGSYIDALSLETGQKMWGNAYNTLSDSLFETHMSIFERSDGNIELTGFRLANVVPNAVPLGPATRRVLNRDSGLNIADKFTTNLSDGACYCINPNGQFGRIFPIIQDEKYLASCMYVSSILNTIHWQRSLDGEGVTIDTIGYVDDLTGESSFRYIDGVKLPNGNIAIGISSFFFPTVLDRRLTEILILSPEGELLDRVDITDLVSFAGFFYMDLRGDKLYINAPSLNEELTIFDRENFIIMDQEGNVLTSISDFDELDGQKVNWIRGTSLDANNSIVLGTDTKTDKNCLKFFKLDSSGNIDHLRTICHPDTTWEILTRSIIVHDNDLIVQSGWQWSEEEIFPASFSIGLDQLGIISSSNEKIKENDRINIFPNPTKGLVNISLPTTTTGLIEICNLDGRVILSKPFYNSDSVSINTEGLLSGTYIVYLKSASNVYSSKLMIAN